MICEESQSARGLPGHLGLNSFTSQVFVFICFSVICLAYLAYYNLYHRQKASGGVEIEPAIKSREPLVAVLGEEGEEGEGGGGEGEEGEEGEGEGEGGGEEEEEEEEEAEAEAEGEGEGGGGGGEEEEEEEEEGEEKEGEGEEGEGGGQKQDSGQFTCPLCQKQKSAKKDSKPLATLLENFPVLHNICASLDALVPGCGNYEALAHYYGFSYYEITSVLKKYEGGPSRGIIEYVVATAPELSVEAFATLVEKKANRKDVSKLLREYDSTTVGQENF